MILLESVLTWFKYKNLNLKFDSVRNGQDPRKPYKPEVIVNIGNNVLVQWRITRRWVGLNWEHLTVIWPNCLTAVWVKCVSVYCSNIHQSLERCESESGVTENNWYKLYLHYQSLSINQTESSQKGFKISHACTWVKRSSTWTCKTPSCDIFYGEDFFGGVKAYHEPGRLCDIFYGEGYVWVKTWT